MQLDLPRIIEHAADDVAHAGRSAAGSLGGLVHDLDPRSLRRSRRGGNRTTIIVAIVAVVAALLVAQRVMARRNAKPGGTSQATAASSPVPEAARNTDTTDEVYAAEGLS